MANAIKDVLAASEEKDKMIAELESRLEEVNDVIKDFGRKKQRYLRRMARRKEMHRGQNS